MSVLPTYMTEKPVDLNNELELNNLKSEIISQLLDDNKLLESFTLSKMDDSNVRNNTKRNNLIQEYWSNKIEALLKLSINEKLEKPSSIAESILFTGEFPSGVVPGVIDVMKKYSENSDEKSLEKENKLNNDPFTQFSSITHLLSSENNGIGLKFKRRYNNFSEVEKEYIKKITLADSDELNNDGLFYTDFMKKKHNMTVPFFDINMSNKHLSKFEPLPAYFNINDSLYLFNSEMKDRTQVFRFSGSKNSGNIGLFETSNDESETVKLYQNIPMHVRSVLSHSYRNIDIPRTANVYDHTIFEGNPDKCWCLETENKILIEAENPTINSVMVLPNITSTPTRNNSFVKLDASEKDIGLNIHNIDNLLDILEQININGVGFILFSKWLEKRLSIHSDIISNLQIESIQLNSFSNVPIDKKHNGFIVKKTIENILQSLFIKSRELEDNGLIDVDISDSNFIIKTNENSHPIIKTLIKFVQKTDSINFILDENDLFSVYYAPNLELLRRLSMFLNILSLSLKWSSFTKINKYRILFALRRYSQKNIIEKDDYIYFKNILDESKLVDRYNILEVYYDYGTIQVLDETYNKQQLFYLENEFGIVKKSLKIKNYPVITQIPQNLTEKMNKDDEKILTEIYFPYLLDSIIPSNTDIISKNSLNFNGYSLGQLKKILKNLGLSEKIVGNELSLLMEYILTNNIQSIPEQNRSIHYPMQLISNLQPFPKYTKNKFTQKSTNYEIQKLENYEYALNDNTVKYIHIFSDSLITHPDVIRAYGEYPGIIKLQHLSANDQEFLKKSGWKLFHKSNDRIKSKYGYALFDSLESRISWVRNQSDNGAFYFEFIKFSFTKKIIKKTELEKNLEEAELKLSDSSNFLRECNDGDDDKQLQDLADDVIRERKERGRGRGYTPEAIEKTYKSDKDQTSLTFENQMAKTQIINCIQERMINQRNYINFLKTQLYEPNFNDLIEFNLWKQNKDYQFSKHPRYPVILKENNESEKALSKVKEYLNLNEIDSITDSNIKIIEVNNLIQKYGNLNNPTRTESYPINKTGWIESKIGVKYNNKFSKNSRTIFPNLYCSHWLLLQKRSFADDINYQIINNELISLYGNQGLETESSSNQGGFVSDFISRKTCGLPLQLNELDDFMKSDGQLKRMNDLTLDGLVGTDPLVLKETGYNYSILVRKHLNNTESISIYDLLVDKIIDKLHFNFKPEEVKDIIDSVKVEIDQISFTSNNQKILYRMSCLGAYLLIYLQINSEIYKNMNNHYKIQFFSIFGTRRITGDKQSELKIYGSDQIDNGIDFITKLLIKIGVPIKGTEDKKIKDMYSSVREYYKHILEIRPELSNQVSRSKINRNKSQKKIEITATTTKTKNECDKSLSLTNEMLNDRITLDKLWGNLKNEKLTSHSVIDGTAKICSMYTASEFNKEEFISDKIPIEIMGQLKSDLNEKIESFIQIRKKVRNESKPLMNKSKNITYKNENRFSETTQTSTIEIYRQFNSTLVKNENNPENLFGIYCHKFVENPEYKFPKIGTKHIFTHFNRTFTYNNCLELGGEYLNSICINCGAKVIDIKQKLQDKYYESLYERVKMKIVNSESIIPTKINDEQLYDSSNVLSQKLDETDLDKEISTLLETINKVFIGTEHEEKISTLNIQSIKNMFQLEKSVNEKNVEFINQFGLGDIMGYDYEPINNQLKNMVKSNVPTEIVSNQKKQLELKFETKKNVYKKSIDDGLNADIIMNVIHALKEMLKEINMVSNNKLTSADEDLSSFKEYSSIFKDMKKLLLYNSELLSRKCLICLDPKRNVHVKGCNKSDDKNPCFESELWHTLFIRQLNLLISADSDTSTKVKVDINLHNYDTDETEKVEIFVNKKEFTILNLRREIASKKALSFGNVSIFTDKDYNDKLNDSQNIPKADIFATIKSGLGVELFGDIEEIDVSEENKIKCLYIIYFIKKLLNRKQWKDVTREGIRDIRSLVFAENKTLWNKDIKRILDNKESRMVSQTLANLKLLDYDRNSLLASSLTEMSLLNEEEGIKEMEEENLVSEIAEVNDLNENDLDDAQKLENLIYEHHDEKNDSDFEEMNGGYDSDVFDGLFEDEE